MHFVLIQMPKLEPKEKEKEKNNKQQTQLKKLKQPSSMLLNKKLTSSAPWSFPCTLL